MRKTAPPIKPGRHVPFVMLSSILTPLLLSPAAIAHDSWMSRQQFIDPSSGSWCCDENDCTALEVAEVRETAQGFMVAGKYFVSRLRVLPSQDGSYWACFNSEGQGAHDRKAGVRCFFAPMSS